MNQSIKLFSVLSDQFQENPYAYFSQLREEDPVHYEESIDSYFISRYHDVRYILRILIFSRLNHLLSVLNQSCAALCWPKCMGKNTPQKEEL